MDRATVVREQPHYTLQGYWGPRRETAAACAVRFWNLLQGLGQIDLLFRDWRFIGRSRFLRMPQGLGAELTRLVEATVVRDDYEAPDPMFGYHFGASARAGKNTCLTMRVHAGCYIPKPRSLANTVNLETARLNPGIVPLIALPTCRAALLAIAAAWDATWCMAYPDDIMPFWPQPPARENLRLGWIIYLSPRFAPLVTPPRSVISEKTADGGILMSATADRFDVSNPAHMAAAREIHDSLAAFNALPWPPDEDPAA